MARENGTFIRINRIRLEFKANPYALNNALIPVLIESDWNLKGTLQVIRKLRNTVLIESDWNLKFAYTCLVGCSVYRINRIRLEFKVDNHFKIRFCVMMY